MTVYRRVGVRAVWNQIHTKCRILERFQTEARVESGTLSKSLSSINTPIIEKRRARWLLRIWSVTSPSPKNDDLVVPEDLAVLSASAERELGAFMKAVTDTFGSKEGRLAGEDWLQVLDSKEELPGTSADDWRSITIAAAFRLATRLNAASVR